MYVYGEIRYTDTFGREQVTKYRLIHGGREGVRKSPGKDPAGADIWILNPDSSGNEAT
jgi:hypothetical protein